MQPGATKLLQEEPPIGEPPLTRITVEMHGQQNIKLTRMSKAT
jgi:hypothetical protein